MKMRRKRLLFVMPSFLIGGTVVSTKNLLLLLDRTQYDITIVAMSSMGELKLLYDDEKQLSSNFILEALTARSWRDVKKPWDYVRNATIRLLGKNSVLRRFLLRCAGRKLLRRQCFDVVVACEEGICTHFVSLLPTKAKRVAWVRCDYSRYIAMNGHTERTIYDKFDNIVCVSAIVANKFKSIYPEFSNKVRAINNPQSEEFLQRQAKIDDCDVRFDTSSFTIVSVGRISAVKRFEAIPKIASELLKRGIRFKWYIIGGGVAQDEQILQQQIRDEGVADNVVWLGVKTNPHYYINNADLLVVLSSSEACPRVINEAKVLHTPVVSTDFDTVYEYIEDDKNGVICKLDEVHCAIEEMIVNKELYNRIRNEVADFHFDNNDLMRAVTEIL